MKTILLLLGGLIALLSIPLQAAAPAAAEDAAATPYLGIKVDRVVIDTAGLASASATLAGSVDRLALAVSHLSANDLDLTAEQKQVLLATMHSVDAASQALTALAQKLPSSAQHLGDRLPEVVANARAPLAELGSGLEAARASIYYITESLPQATENAKLLVNSTLDSAMIRLSVFTTILIGAIALALIGIMWFIYRQYLDPLARKLDELVGAPQHFDNMSRYMSETAHNLVELQCAETRAKLRSAERYRRQGAFAQRSERR